jgi:hypothetical protein
MGQQQLLLIVLGVIIVGVAVIVGLNLFHANDREARTDLLVNESLGYAALLMQYYQKPNTMGGGGRSFLNFPPPSGGRDWVPYVGSYGWQFIDDDKQITIMLSSQSASISAYDFSAVTRFRVGPITGWKGTINVAMVVHPTSFRAWIADSED